ncbi:MAG: rod shape-determining protein MreD [Zoogloea sp.]|uniref:rod shape-determining protein MreD n=1 Tax=Zoogloea sp. TaxID=49181 RepID=UPI003F396CF5
MAVQPTHASRRILLPARNWFIYCSLFLALFLNLIPLGRFPGVPDWVALVLVFWTIHQPLRVGMGAAFWLGLLMDVGDGSVMGQHALAYVSMCFVADILSRRILWFSLFQQAVHVFPMLLLTQVVMLVVRLIAGDAFPGFAWFIASVTGTLLWYPLTFLLLLPQYRPVERDENRPI